MQSAVKLLGSDVMERWQHFLRKICIDATSSIFPVSSPTLRGQLLYRIEVEHSSVVALLDHGASHSFMSKEWALRNHVPIKPLSYLFYILLLQRYPRRHLTHGLPKVRADWSIQQTLDVLCCS